MSFILNHQIKKNPIYEGLIHSTSVETAGDMIEKWGGSTNKIKVVVKFQKIQLNFVENLSLDEFKNLFKLINNLGWFISGVLIFGTDINWRKFDLRDFLKNDFNKRWLSFQLEAKYDLETDVHDFDVMYHITPTKHVDKILKIGLTPRSKEKILSHPSRIYLTDNEEDADIIAFRFQKDHNSGSLTLLKINFKQAIKDDPTIRLFSDPNFKGAFYTLSNIHPRFIENMGEYQP